VSRSNSGLVAVFRVNCPLRIKPVVAVELRLAQLPPPTEMCSSALQKSARSIYHQKRIAAAQYMINKSHVLGAPHSSAQVNLGKLRQLGMRAPVVRLLRGLAVA